MNIEEFIHDLAIEEKDLEGVESSMDYDGDCVRKRSNWMELKNEYKFDHNDFDPKKLLDAIPKESPKLAALLNKIDELDSHDLKKHGKRFKHLIYSDVRVNGYGAKMIAGAFIAMNMRLGYMADGAKEYYKKGKASIFNEGTKEKGKGKDKSSTIGGGKYGKIAMLSDAELMESKGDNFLLLASINVYDQPILVSTKNSILSTFNKRPENVQGDLARFIILDSGYKEGIDIFDIKYVHLFEPSITNADQKQVIGRGTRTCGQKGLTFHPTRGWPLYVYIYDMTIPDGKAGEFMNAKTFFELYTKSMNMDMRLFQFQQDLERVAVMGSVDYELNRAIHHFELPPDDTDYLLGGSMTGGSKTVKPWNKPWDRTFKDVLTEDTELPKLLSSSSSDKYEKLKNYITKEFEPFKWSNIKMENQCVPMSGGKHNGGSKQLTEQEYARMQRLKQVIPGYEKRLQGIRTSELIREVEESDSDSGSDSDSDSDSDEEDLIPAIDEERERRIKSLLQLNPTQDFVRHYFVPQIPLKGMLLWHSVGTGKTCTAIATASDAFEKAGYTVLWVTRATLKSDVVKNIFKDVCSMSIRDKIINDPQYRPPVKPVDQRKQLSKSYSWSIPMMSYKQFSNLVNKGNSMYNQLVRRNGAEDPLKKTLIIIDEVHKLYGASDLPINERPNMASMEKAIQHSYQTSGKDSVRLMVMTATPITQNPMELVKIMNLLKPTHEQMPTDFDDFSKKFLDDSGKFTKEGEKDFLNNVAGNISYLNREKDARQFAQPKIEVVSVVLDEKVSNSKDKEEKNAKRDELRELEEKVREKDKEFNRERLSLPTKIELRLSKCGSIASKEEKAACHLSADGEYLGLKGKVEGLKKELAEMEKALKSKKRELKGVPMGDGNEDTGSMFYKMKQSCGIAGMDDSGSVFDKHPDILKINEQIRNVVKKINELKANEATDPTVRPKIRERTTRKNQLLKERRTRIDELRKTIRGHFSIERKKKANEEREAMIKEQQEAALRAKEELRRRIEEEKAKEAEAKMRQKEEARQEAEKKRQEKAQQELQIKQEQLRAKNEERQRQLEEKAAERQKELQAKEAERRRKEEEKQRDLDLKATQKQRERLAKEAERQRKEQEKEEEKRKKEQEKEANRTRKLQEKAALDAEKARNKQKAGRSPSTGRKTRKHR